jgi:hypothetical protein
VLRLPRGAGGMGWQTELSSAEFVLIVAGDEADSNCGEISCCFYRTGERHLIAGANWYLLGRSYAPARYVHSVEPRAFRALARVINRYRRPAC